MAIKYSMRDLIRDVIHLCSRIGKISVALYTGWFKNLAHFCMPYTRI